MSVALQLRHFAEPIFGLQIRNLLEVDTVSRQHRRVLAQSNGGYFQIHRADADFLAAQVLELAGGCVVPRQHVPTPQRADELMQFRVARYLGADHSLPMDER